MDQAPGQRLRLVIVVSCLKFGGAETQVIAQARELARLGHIVAVYALNSVNPRARELEGSGVQFIADQKKRPLDVAVLWRLHQFLKTFRADVVHGFLYDGNLYARVAAIGLRIPALSSERSDNYRLNLVQRIGHRLTRSFADGVIANSHAGRRFAQGMYRLPPERLHVVWNGIDLAAVDAKLRHVDPALRSGLFAEQGVKIACMVANIKPAKDYLLALRVVAELVRRDSSWRVVFVGEPFTNLTDYHHQVKQLFDELGLQKHAIFCSHRTDVLELLSQCDVMFSTSFNEGFPNVVLESMAVGTPVVSTVYSDIRQILPYAWQVVEQRNAEAIVDAIVRAYGEGAELGRAQRLWVEQHASVPILGTNLQGLYQQYVGHLL